jgi:rRNA maturation RNase YbeY
MPIAFRPEKISFSLKRKNGLENWITSVIRKEKKRSGEIHYIFCSDAFLLKLNKQFLHHDTLTDIITFDYSEGKTIAGEIYISIPRVKENARNYRTPFETELHRVMIHGILHLCGYKDKTAKAKTEMRKAEDRCLELLKR